MNNHSATKQFYVYGHTRPDTNELFYIGVGFKGRAYSKSGRNRYWHAIVNKNNGHFKVSIIHENITKEQACKIEVILIKLYGRKCFNEGFLCNISTGGEYSYGVKKSSEAIAKAKLRTGKNHNMFGIPKPEIVKNKISATKKGIKMSEVNKVKISQALRLKYSKTEHHSKGSKSTIETRLKISEGVKRATLEGRRKNSTPSGSNHWQCKGTIYQYCKNTGMFIAKYESTGIAERSTGIHSGRISAVILGKRKSCNGFIFSRVN